MECPAEVAEILLEVLQAALLRARARGWAGDAPGCAVEADHVHNLPSLIHHFSEERLRYYWEVERVSFTTRIEAADRRAFEPLWERLGRHVAPAPAAR
jgi:hypothetical protein